MNATRLGLCRTDTHEPALVGGSTGDRGANKQRLQGRQKELTHSSSGALELID